MKRLLLLSLCLCASTVKSGEGKVLELNWQIPKGAVMLPDFYVVYNSTSLAVPTNLWFNVATLRAWTFTHPPTNQIMGTVNFTFLDQNGWHVAYWDEAHENQYTNLITPITNLSMVVNWTNNVYFFICSSNSLGISKPSNTIGIATLEPPDDFQASLLDAGMSPLLNPVTRPPKK
jgi:hypothetical protein